MSVTVTPIYAALIGILFVILSVRVIAARRSARVALGDGGDKVLLRCQRVQANCAEYAPLALVLMTLAELQAAPALVLHAIGTMLLGGRVVHAAGVSQENEQFAMRVTGMALTFTAILSAAAVNLLGPSALGLARAI